MIVPPQWTAEELEADRMKSLAIFRRERMKEPLEDYLEAFEEYQGIIEELLEKTIDLTDLDGAALDILTDQEQLHTFRYLAGPPISEADLQVLADTDSLAKSRLQADPEAVRRIVETVRQALDRRRFVWVTEGREPTEAERAAAVIASAALRAVSRVQTNRRNLSKEEQEDAVKEALKSIGLIEVPRRKIATMAEAPRPGEFCGESEVSGQKADIVLGLWDNRLLPIECKVTNSFTNSIKRLNREAVGKARAWLHALGHHQVVPAATLSGAFKLKNLQDAQNSGLTIFWAHNLEALTAWVQKSKPA